MGFETCPPQNTDLFALHYETSLWDLKLEDPYTSCILQEIMRHPYGI